MTKYLKLFEFFPIALFLYFARSQGWQTGFEYGALAAAVQFVVLFSLKVSISRLVAGVNLFLILGGTAFFFNIDSVLKAMGDLRESLLFVCILVVVLIGTFCSNQGAFEKNTGNQAKVRRYSLYFAAAVFICVIWAYYFKGNSMIAGTYPFLMLIVLRMSLQRLMHES